MTSPKSENKDVDKTQVEIEMEVFSFDDVLHKIGQTGRFQMQLLFVMLLVAVSAGFQNFCPVFTLTTPDHRCAIPGLQNDTFEVQSPQHRYLINSTIPLDEKGTYRKCYIQVEVDHSNGSSTFEKQTCSHWVYDQSVFKSTLTGDLNLVCSQKIMRSHSNMLIFAGKFFGAILQGISSDIFGRQKIFLVTLVCLLACSVGNAFVYSIEALFALRFFTGMLVTASYLSMFVLAMEFMGPRYRTRVTTVARFTFAIGQLLLDLTAYTERDWRHLQLALIWPCALALLCFWMVPESPRWLLAKNKAKHAEKIMQRVASVNKVQLPENTTAKVKLDQVQTSAPAIHLFTDFRLATRWMVIYINWTVVGMVYYGLSLNISNLSGDIFLNFCISVGSEILAIVLIVCVVERVSRKYLHASAMLLSGLACGATFIPMLLDSQRWIIVTMSMVGKLGISCGFYLVYTLTAEIFPTAYRGFGMGSSSMIARVGGMASPYVADLNTYVSGPFGEVLPQLVFGSLGIVAGLLTFYLPETRNRKLPETIQDAKNFGTEKPKKVANSGISELPKKALELKLLT